MILCSKMTRNLFRVLSFGMYALPGDCIYIYVSTYVYMYIYVYRCVRTRVFTCVYVCTHMVDCFLNVSVIVLTVAHIRKDRVKKTRGWQVALPAVTGASVHAVQRASRLQSVPGMRRPRLHPVTARGGEVRALPSPAARRLCR